MDDPSDLQRFLTAQAPVYRTVLSELRDGRKRSHWMWFVFPQLAGLGMSPMAQRYAIASLDEARAYLEHPMLGGRLREAISIVNGLESRSAHEIFGSPDDMKFRSCLTLFREAAPEEGLFQVALDKFYGGAADERTLQLLRR